MSANALEELMQEQTRGLTGYEAADCSIWWSGNCRPIPGSLRNSSFDRNRFSILWRRVCSDRYFCANKSARFYPLFYHAPAQSHEEANLVVVNHSLLLADMKSENSSWTATSI